MFLELRPGRLIDALAGTVLEPAAIEAAVATRSALFRQLGLLPHERVLLHYGNRPAFFIDLLAIWRCGACASPLDPRATPVEIANLARVVGPKLSLWDEPPAAAALAGLEGARIVTTGESPAAGARAGAPAGAAPDDAALILFTSGTTGDPKGVVHTHRSLAARWFALREVLGTQACARTLCLLPTHFGHGLICNCLYPWLSGSDLFLLPPFRADLLLGLGEFIDRHAITFLSSVPPVWRLALKTARPPRGGTLRRVFCGSAPLSKHLWDDIATWTGAGEVGNVYGITETGSWIAGSFAPGDRADGRVGRGWGTVLAVLRHGDATTPPCAADACAAGEEGFVWCRTPGLMRGYLGRDDLTARVVSGGWFSTGDIGALDAQARLQLRGRQREEINKGGMKIFPGDIDAAIERFPGVSDVCTFACDHPLYGEEVGVALVMQAGLPVDLPALARWVEQQLGAHRLPGRWFVLDEIPRTSRGKVNRAQVADACAGRAPLSSTGPSGPAA
jgi:acyl-CoA synthetase (AMP-forming)/AMP-acid ligase II